MSKKVILITGASSGIGETCLNYLLAQGHIVYGTSRKDHPSGSMIRADVTDLNSMRQTVDFIVEKHGYIDVLINNAGVSLVSPIEETTIQDAQVLMDTNLWGVVNTTNLVLPIMRNRGAGLIITIGSLAGLFAIPFQAFYSMGKHALEAWVESLRMEVKPFGIKACIIEPGDFNTSISQNRTIRRLQGPYAVGMDKVYDIIYKGESTGPDPILIARKIEKIIHSNNPKVRYAIGKTMDLISIPLKKILPQRLFEFLIREHYGI